MDPEAETALHTAPGLLFNGPSPSLWREAVDALGDDGVISALAVTCVRHAAGEIRTAPGAYLGGMVRKHRIRPAEDAWA